MDEVFYESERKSILYYIYIIYYIIILAFVETKNYQIPSHSADTVQLVYDLSVYRFFNSVFSTVQAEGTVVDAGSTVIVAKLGQRLPDDLAEAKEAKVEPYSLQAYM